MKTRSVISLLLSVWLSSPTRATGETGSVSEYRLKAAFLFNFTQYVKWPDTAFAETNAPIIIGILGKDPFESLLDDTIRGEKVQGRALKVRRSQRGEVLEGCHILFISASEKARLKDVLAVFRDRPVLTVSDIENFAARCGMIGFVLKERRLALQVNLDGTKRAGLRVDSRLLALAETVPCERVEGK